jgi:hypothetical protein
MFDAVIKEGTYKICHVFDTHHPFFAYLFNGRWHNIQGELIDLRSTPEKLCNEEIVRRVGGLPRDWWPKNFESFSLFEKEM